MDNILSYALRSDVPGELEGYLLRGTVSDYRYSVTNMETMDSLTVSYETSVYFLALKQAQPN